MRSINLLLLLLLLLLGLLPYLEVKRSKIKVITQRSQFDACLPITRQKSQILASAATWRIKIKMITIFYENYSDNITLRLIE